MFLISQIHLDRYLGPLSRHKKIVQNNGVFEKNAFFSKKCITRAFFIFFFLNNIENVKEGSKLSKIMCYMLKSIKNWWNSSRLKITLKNFFSKNFLGIFRYRWTHEILIKQKNKKYVSNNFWRIGIGIRGPADLKWIRPYIIKTRYTAYSATLHLKYIDFGVPLIPRLFIKRIGWNLVYGH